MRCAATIQSHNCSLSISSSIFCALQDSMTCRQHAYRRYGMFHASRKCHATVTSCCRDAVSSCRLMWQQCCGMAACMSYQPLSWCLETLLRLQVCYPRGCLMQWNPCLLSCWR